MNRFYRNTLFLIFPISLCVSFIFDPIFHPDSKDYISYHPARSVGYPFFIYILDENLKLVLFFQSFFSLFSVLLFVREIKYFFNFNNYIIVFLSSILVLITTKISLNILTGSLAFSFFLLFMTTIIKSLQKKQDTFLFLALFILFIGVIIRPQLIFLVVSLILTASYIFSKKFKKQTLLIFPLTLLIFFVPNKINLYFNNLFNEVNVPITDTWNQLMILPIFITNEEIIEKSHSKYKNLLINIHQCLVNKGLTKKIAKNNGNNWLHVLEDNSFIIKNCSNVEIEKEFPKNNLTENENVSKELFFDIFLTNLKYDRINISESYFLKFSSAFINQYYLIIFLFFFLFLINKFLRKNDDRFFFFLQLIFTHLSNLIIILIGAPYLTRFKFYTELTLMLMIFLVIIDYFSKGILKNKDGKK